MTKGFISVFRHVYFSPVISCEFPSAPVEFLAGGFGDQHEIHHHHMHLQPVLEVENGP